MSTAYPLHAHQHIRPRQPLSSSLCHLPLLYLFTCLSSWCLFSVILYLIFFLTQDMPTPSCDGIFLLTQNISTPSCGGIFLLAQDISTPSYDGMFLLTQGMSTPSCDGIFFLAQDISTPSCDGNSSPYQRYLHSIL